MDREKLEALDAILERFYFAPDVPIRVRNAVWKLHAAIVLDSGAKATRPWSKSRMAQSEQSE